MAWSIFSDGGGRLAAEQWAEDLLTALGVPVTESLVQFVYDWEVSEGGGGKFNPLNQGPVPGHPDLTSTGPQFGGGAADFVSREAGIQGAFLYLHMPNYTHVLAAIVAGDAGAARDALIASPWAAGHYGGGRNFSNAPLPSAFRSNVTSEESMRLLFSARIVNPVPGTVVGQSAVCISDGTWFHWIQSPQELADTTGIVLSQLGIPVVTHDEMGRPVGDVLCFGRPQDKATADLLGLDFP